LVVGVAFYLNDRHEEEQSLTRISASELSFENLLLKQDYNSYKIVGRIINHSQRFEASDISIVVTVQDCKPDVSPPSCLVIGESKESLFLNIPPGQARDFEHYVFFDTPVKPQGQLSWDYRIESISAREITS
jgi:hypothetical protein